MTSVELPQTQTQQDSQPQPFLQQQQETLQVRGFAIVTFNWVEQLRLSEEAKYQAEELRLKAEVKAGKCLKEMEKNEGGEWTHKDKECTPHVHGGVQQDVSPSLSQLGISYNQSANFQAISDLEEEEIEEIVEQAKEQHKPVPAASTLAEQKRKNKRTDVSTVDKRKDAGLKPVRPEFWWTEDYINDWSRCQLIIDDKSEVNDNPTKEKPKEVDIPSANENKKKNVSAQTN